MDQDRYLSCSTCGTRFLWTSWEQREQAGQPACCPGCRKLMPAGDRKRGQIKFYNQRRGWGFITCTDGLEVFVHRSKLHREEEHPLQEGALVEFGLELARRGPQAKDVQRLVISSEEGT